MDVKFFESLTPDEAEGFLQSFLCESTSAMPSFIASASAAGVTGDFTLPSVSPLFAWIGESVKTVPLQPGPGLPEWIRASPTYATYLFDVDESSKLVILRAGYYLGESFVRAYPTLRWSVGKSDTAQQGQPVVTGFKHGMELAALLVTENVLAREVAEPAEVPAIETAVITWSSRV